MDQGAAEQAIDPAAIERLRKLGGPAFVAEMIDLFGQYVPGRLAAARDALKSGDLPALAKAVHPLKSSAGNVGARRMLDLARQIEGEAASGAAAGLPALMDRLAAECEAALRALAVARQEVAVATRGEPR